MKNSHGSCTLQSMYRLGATAHDRKLADAGVDKQGLVFALSLGLKADSGCSWFLSG